MQEERMKDTVAHLLHIGRQHSKQLCQLLKPLGFRQNATFLFSESGCKVITNDEHSIQAALYMTNELFSKFTIRDEQVAFTVHLQTLLECLSVLDGPMSNFVLSYDGMGEPIKIMAEENGVVLEASVPTMANHLNDLDFGETEDLVHIMMKPSILRDTMKDLDPSSEHVIFRCTEQRLSIATKGDLGVVQTIFPRLSEEVEKFQCTQSVCFAYRSVLLKKMAASVAIASKVNLLLDDTGILQLQCLVELSEDEKPFIVFKCLPVVLPDEEGEENNDAMEH